MRILLAALVVLGAGVEASAQSGKPKQDPTEPPAQASDAKTGSTGKRNTRQEATESETPKSETRAIKQPETKDPQSRYTYEFKQPNFIISHIVIDHDETGRGKITFERQGEEQPIVEPLNLSEKAFSRINGLWHSLGFLDSREDYQSQRQYPHLGTMRLRMTAGGRERETEFNWTNNKDAFALVNEYRHAADQAIWIFDISVARENQPLNTPKLMEYLGMLLKSGGLSDPRQLLPLLRELKTDERIPLIARNDADRFVKKIEK
jgi:hypothetical protein